MARLMPGGRNVNWTTSDALADIAGQSTFHSNLVEIRRKMSLDFMRGLEPEGSVVDVRELGGGRGYLRLVFFGRRTLEDVRKALNGFVPPALDVLL